jgi:hypothetical protein
MRLYKTWLQLVTVTDLFMKLLGNAINKCARVFVVGLSFHCLGQQCVLVCCYVEMTLFSSAASGNLHRITVTNLFMKLLGNATTLSVRVSVWSFFSLSVSSVCWYVVTLR